MNACSGSDTPDCLAEEAASVLAPLAGIFCGPVWGPRSRDGLGVEVGALVPLSWPALAMGLSKPKPDDCWGLRLPEDREAGVPIGSKDEEDWLLVPLSFAAWPNKPKPDDCGDLRLPDDRADDRDEDEEGWKDEVNWPLPLSFPAWPKRLGPEDCECLRLPDDWEGKGVLWGNVVVWLLGDCTWETLLVRVTGSWGVDPVRWILSRPDGALFAELRELMLLDPVDARLLKAEAPGVCRVDKGEVSLADTKLLSFTDKLFLWGSANDPNLPVARRVRLKLNEWAVIFLTALSHTISNSL